MTRITAIDPAAATGPAKELFGAVRSKLGMIPNMMRTMAQSPAVLEGYLSFNNALNHGLLPARFREQIALAVAQANRCDYCLSAHTTLGRMAGLKDGEMTAARSGSAADPKSEAGLRFAQAVVRSRGQVSDQEIESVRAAGYGDGEIAEIIAHVALNVLTNYFNVVARTDIDFTRVSAADVA